MTREPFNIKSFIFDLLLSSATLILGAIISFAIFIVLTGDQEEGLAIGAFTAIPVGTTIFYIIRHRFNFRTTFIQIILTSLITFGLIILWIKFLNYLPDYYTYEAGYLIIIVVSLIFVLTKHISDKIILTKYYST